MNEIYNNFRLLGYKINELSNSYFIARKPDRTECLFDSKGKLIIRNVAEIGKITDKLYSCCEIDERGLHAERRSLFTSKGEILDNGLILRGRDQSMVYVRNQNKINVYVDDGILILKGLSGYTTSSAIKCLGEYWVLVTKSKYMVPNNKYSLINSKGETIELDDITDVMVNNHYVRGTPDEAKYKNIVRNHAGELLYSGGMAIIDTINLDNDTVVIKGNDNIHVIQGKSVTDIQNSRVVNGIMTSFQVIKIQFTSNKEVLVVEDTQGKYILNIRTQAKSEYFDNIHIKGLVAVRKVNGIDIFYKMNTETMEIIDSLRANREDDRYAFYDTEIVIANRDIRISYSYDLRPLLREF